MVRTTFVMYIIPYNIEVGTNENSRKQNSLEKNILNNRARSVFNIDQNYLNINSYPLKCFFLCLIFILGENEARQKNLWANLRRLCQLEFGNQVLIFYFFFTSE